MTVNNLTADVDNPFVVILLLVILQYSGLHVLGSTQQSLVTFDTFIRKAEEIKCNVKLY